MRTWTRREGDMKKCCLKNLYQPPTQVSDPSREQNIPVLPAEPRSMATTEHPHHLSTNKGRRTSTTVYCLLLLFPPNHHRDVERKLFEDNFQNTSDTGESFLCFQGSVIRRCGEERRPCH